MSTLLSIVAVVAVLLTVAPLLVPVAALAYVPIAVVGVRNTQALYRLRYGLAELDRDRAYHERLLTGRLEAKEVRAFGLADWLRGGHDRLFAERVRHTRTGRRASAPSSLSLGSSVTALITVSALAVVMLLALDERISVADAAVAIVSLQQISGRLRSLGEATTSMVEGVTFLRDFESFQHGRRAGDRHDLPPTSRPASPGVIRLDHVSYRYPAGNGDALVDVNLQLRPGPGGRHRRAQRCRQVDAGQAVCAVSTPPPQGASTGTTSTPPMCDPAAVRALVAPVFQDFARFEHSAQATIGFGDLDRVETTDSGVRRPPNGPAPTPSWRRCPAGYDTRLVHRRSPAAPSCPSASGSASPSPGRSSATLLWSSWTNPLPPSMPGPSGTSSSASTTSAGTGWSSSSPTASRRSAAPTRSWCCSTGEWPRRAPMRS